MEDLRKYFITQLIQIGCSADGEESLTQLGINFFNIMKRSISLNPRTVFEAKEFHCPNEFKTGYQSLKKKVTSGENLNPHLSKLRLDSNAQDHLLYNWGIHHFYLGQIFYPPEFVCRTSPLMFAYVTNDKFFLFASCPTTILATKTSEKLSIEIGRKS